ncbi:MAG: S8 family serine peptidase, partial [Gemmatimonadaceae bacterium]
MTIRSLSAAAMLAAVVLAGCKDGSPIPHTPTHLVVVSGANQSADLSAPLDSALVVRVLDGAEKPVAGVLINWTVTGGGAVSAATSTTDKNGHATVTWTLAPTAGVQVVTVTSALIAGASVSFIANNGATISGTITPAGGQPFGAAFSRAAAAGPRLSVSGTNTPHRAPTSRIIVGFKDQALGVIAAGVTGTRALGMARQSAAVLQQRAAAFSSTMPVSGAEVSPAMLAARLRVDDTTQISVVMAKLRSDPNVAWVERDDIISIHDRAPVPTTADLAQSNRTVTSPAAGPAGPTTRLGLATTLPNDPGFVAQSWPSNMTDLPRAWAITTGSANVTVAVVDMGVRFDHPDIAGNLTNDGYDFVSHDTYYDTPQTRCGGGTFTTIDGDGDGPDADPTDPDDIDFNSTRHCWASSTLGDHGLWTAGIIGASGNNAAGGTGVNWTVHIRPVRVLGINGEGWLFDVAQGILYAAGLPALGANNALVQAPSRAPIINVSLGGNGDNTLQAAVSAAINAGSLIIASAGNNSSDRVLYPAGFAGVMAVAAVGQDGTLATYSNAGQAVSVAAPGGDFRFDDNGGGGIVGPGWDFTTNRPTYLYGYGTSASAPYVSGIAALLLAQTPTLTAAQLRVRIEQYATRPAGVTRSDALGWGVVNAYNSLSQTNGPVRQTIVKLIDATTGVPTRSIVASNGSFVFTRVAAGSYFVEAGGDENGDATIGVPGRPFSLAGGLGAPTLLAVNANSQSVAIVLGTPTEAEPNDDVAHANTLTAGSYVVGNITTPDVSDVYSVTIATPGQYTFETSGVVGACAFGIELDTYLAVTSAAGVAVGA